MRNTTADWTRRQWTLAALGGMAACAAPTPESVEVAEQAPAVKPFVIDLHCDTPMRIRAEGFDLGRRNDHGQVDIPRMRDGGVSAVFFSVYCPGKRGRTPEKFDEALAIIASVEEEVARHPQELTMAGSSAEIERAREDGKIAVLLGIEGGHMIDSSLDNLRRLYERGGRYLTLTHAAHTPWAGSSGGKAADDPGLTALGREIVAEMNRLGMMVDVSHISDKTFGDVMDAAAAPVIASHSSCRAVAGHPRNMTDAMIRRVADGGGVVHINYYNGFLDDEYRARANAAKEFDAKLAEVRKELAGDPRELAAAEWRIAMEKIEKVGRVSFERLLDHFEHAVKVGGVEHVGLGSDFDGVSEELPEGMDDISKMPALMDGLGSRGLGAAAVEKIMGANTLRVMKDAEGMADAGSKSA